MQPTLFILGFIIDALGKVLLGISVILVHGIVYKERKIDIKVLREMKIEKKLSLLGIILIIIGSGIQVWFMI
ncbi:hypothetical protein J4221_00110 [Candidatus Pacearchaeota archaeon]|nr:hypothetical protein [Candidatus Pacearchaeota archaeon]